MGQRLNKMILNKKFNFILCYYFMKIIFVVINVLSRPIEPFIKKKKYLIPMDINFGTAIISIRKNIVGMKSSDALIYIVENRIISPNVMMRELQKKDFLYIKIIKESVFG
jgi:hypothetical protein